MGTPKHLPSMGRDVLHCLLLHWICCNVEVECLRNESGGALGVFNGLHITAASDISQVKPVMPHHKGCMCVNVNVPCGCDSPLGGEVTMSKLSQLHAAQQLAR